MQSVAEIVETTEPKVQHEQPPTGLYQKLHAILKDVQYIQKDKSNEFHRYRYASEAAIKRALHKAFIDHRVLCQFELLDVRERDAAPTKAGKPQWITRVTIGYRFIDIDGGDTLGGTFFGVGIDSEDKGLYKAITGGLKYMLTSMFLIETGDDPEAVTDQGEKVRAAKEQAVDKAAQVVGQDKQGEYKPKEAFESLGRAKDRLMEIGGDAGERKYREIMLELGFKDGKREMKKLYGQKGKELAVDAWKKLTNAAVQWEEFNATTPAEPPVEDEPPDYR